jgi:hypothetical protein
MAKGKFDGAVRPMVHATTDLLQNAGSRAHATLHDQAVQANGALGFRLALVGGALAILWWAPRALLSARGRAAGQRRG